MLTLKTWRRLTVWLHVLTSVGWMSMALALAALDLLGISDTAAREPAMIAAHHLDQVLLAPLAVGSAITGIVLAAATPYGFAHHRWVLTKLVITIVQLYVGIFVLSGTLNDAATAPASAPLMWLAVTTVAMATAIAFQAWLSIAKPWGRTRWSEGRPKPVTGPRWMFAAACAAAIVDPVLGVLTGFPTPLVAVVVLVAVLVGRPRPQVSPRRAGSTSPAR